MSDVARSAPVEDGDSGTAAPGAVPAGQRCVWPGCTRRRAAGRVAGSGRQKEYCLQADPPEAGGGPVHNARNRWSALRGAANRAAPELAASGGADHPATAMGSGEQAAAVLDRFAYSAAKQRASDLLEQARRQHAAAIASLRAERELYQRLSQQLTVLSDPAALDLEIAAIASRAGASVAQAEEETVRARRAQMAAERERDDAIRLRHHADAAAEQLATDAEAAETALAERTAAFDRDRAILLDRARDAENRADQDRATAAAATAAAATATMAAEQAAADAVRDVGHAREEAAAEVASVQARAAEAIARAQRAAEESSAQARRDAAEQVMAAIDRARRQVEASEARADAQSEQARRDVDAARRETVAARGANADAVAGAAAAAARADASATEAERGRDEIARLREEMHRMEAAREAEVARLTAAHQAALDAERTRAIRAETELDLLRGAAS